VLRHVQEAVDKEAFDVLALTGAGGHFSAGADLKYVMQLIDAADWQGLEAYLVLFQETTSAVRYASVPIVAAARGLALGGGCELCLTSAARVVGGELRMGLVETKVGVIPGAGGCKEMVRRFGADIETAFRTLQRGAMSDNGLQARSWGFVEDADPVYLDEERLLSPALARARELVDGGWQPPVAGALDVAGPTVLAGIEEGLSRSASEGDLSAHDVVVGRALAGVLCGAGETAPQSEARLLELEREAFLTLCGTPETRARMEHMLRTGKPLRN
jgi:3-hydroxyacyl-CoA dehydrogenase